MATAKKKVAPKATATPKKVTIPAKVVKSAAKAVAPIFKAVAKKAPESKTFKTIAKIGASIAKLTERKEKINAEINALREQRTALKATAAPAPAAVKVKVKVAAKATPKFLAQTKASKPAAKK